MARVANAVDDDCSKGAKWNSAVAEAKNLIECGIDGTAGCAVPVLPNITFDNPVASFEVSERTSSSSSITVSGCVITVRVTAPLQTIFGTNLVSVPGYNLAGVTLNAEALQRYIGR